MMNTVATICANVLVLAANSGTPKQKLDLYAIEQHVVARTNAERIKSGLSPLLIDQHLVESARRHTAWMTNAGTLQHTSAPVAENIAMGQRTPTEAPATPASGWLALRGLTARSTGASSSNSNYDPRR
jgi:uncharacterized protein YkwD